MQVKLPYTTASIHTIGRGRSVRLLSVPNTIRKPVGVSPIVLAFPTYIQSVICVWKQRAVREPGSGSGAAASARSAPDASSHACEIELVPRPTGQATGLAEDVDCIVLQRYLRARLAIDVTADGTYGSLPLSGMKALF